MKIWYEGSDGNAVDLWRGNIRAVKIYGAMHESDIAAAENSFGDGGVFSGERAAVRTLRLIVRLCGGQAAARSKLRGIFRGGILHFSDGGIQRKISCRHVKTEYGISKLSDRAEVTFLCAEPFFLDENTAAAAAGGIVCLWEFPWELPEAKEFEFSAVNESPCAEIMNTGEVPCGFTAVIYVQRDINGIKIEEPVSGKYISVKMDIPAGSRVYVDTRGGGKSVILYQTSENIPLDITSAAEYGSEFFSLRCGMNRVYFYDSDGGRIDAEISCQGLYGGI